MAQSLFSGLDRVLARALYVGERIELRNFERVHRLAQAPLLVRVGSDGAAVLFRYGVVVLFNLDSVQEAVFLGHLQGFVTQPFESPESEEVEIRLDPEGQDGVSDPNVVLGAFSFPRLQLVADVLAKSVVLAGLETRISTHFDRIEPLASSLQQGGWAAQPGRELLAHIGDVLSVQGQMVGRVEVREKPDLLWEAPELGGLYLRLESEYELSERHVALERKLELISRTASTLLDLLHNRRSLRVEWYIVLLIVVDIVISLGEKLF